MSLYYTLDDGSERLLNVGREKEIEQMNEHAPKIVDVQADGDELDRIERNFTNIPMVKGRRVVTWFGDDAKFIAKNFR